MRTNGRRKQGHAHTHPPHEKEMRRPGSRLRLHVTHVPTNAINCNERPTGLRFIFEFDRGLGHWGRIRALSKPYVCATVWRRSGELPCERAASEQDKMEYSSFEKKGMDWLAVRGISVHLRPKSTTITNGRRRATHPTFIISNSSLPCTSET